MPIAILFSGGKDSCATLYHAIKQGQDVACLASMLPENPDSYMFQTPDERVLRVQAAALRLPLVLQRTKGEKEAELGDLQALLQRVRDEYGIDCVGVGAIASNYQYERVARICDELGLKVFTPLWRKDQETLLREVIAAGFDVRITRIAAEGLDKSWLGVRLTGEHVDKLAALNKRLGINIMGEGGEYETIVLGGPIFAAPVVIAYDIRVESANRGELVIKSAES